MSSFFWSVTDNVRVYTNSVHDPLDIESIFYRSFLLCFVILEY
jgi:hypothetical protein